MKAMITVYVRNCRGWTLITFHQLLFAAHHLMQQRQHPAASLAGLLASRSINGVASDPSEIQIGKDQLDALVYFLVSERPLLSAAAQLPVGSYRDRLNAHLGVRIDGRRVPFARLDKAYRRQG
jgi:hypothetical protein